MSTLTNSQNQIEDVATPRLWWAALVAGIGAFTGALVVFLIGQNMLGLSVVVPQFPEATTFGPLAVGNILGASLVPAIGATILLAVLGRFTKRPFRIFQIIAAIFLFLSLGGPLTLPIGGAEKVLMMVMHSVTAAIILGTLSILGRPSGQS